MEQQENTLQMKARTLIESIWKFPIKVTDTQTIEVPKGAKIMSITTPMLAAKEELPCLYVMVNPAEEEKEKRAIEIYGTGHPIDCSIDEQGMGVTRQFIGTVAMGKRDGNPCI